MAATDLEIANLALSRLGQRPVSALTGSEPDAQLMNSLMGGTRREVLSMFPWNCAIKRETLTHSAIVENLTGFDYAYQLPTDLVRVLDVNGDKNYTYRIEGEYLFSDAGTGDPVEITLRYIFNLATVSLWDELLEEAMVLKLAEKACIRVTNNLNLLGFLSQSYINILTIAQQAASTEDREDITNLLTALNNAKLLDLLTSKNNYAVG